MRWRPETERPPVGERIVAGGVEREIVDPMLYLPPAQGRHHETDDDGGAHSRRSRVLKKMLFGVTFTSAILVLGTAALAACLVPAFRAMRIDPITALRHE